MVCSYLDWSELDVLGFVHHSHATTKLFKDFIVGYSFADHSVWRISEIEFGKISKRYLIFKDFRQNLSIDGFASTRIRSNKVYWGGRGKLTKLRVAMS